MLGQHGHLPLEDVLRLARLALLRRLAHAGDDLEPGLERGLGPQPHGLVGLAEVLPPLGVADERALHAELEEHRRGDLAGVRPLELPVHVLGEHADLGLPEARDRRLERRERRADDDVDGSESLREVADRRRELPRLVRPLEHLPVARDQHDGDLKRRSVLASDAGGSDGGDGDLGAALPRAGDLPARSGRRKRPTASCTRRTSPGIWQVHAWDLATGERRQVTDHPVGVLDGMPTLDGEGVAVVPGRDRRRVGPVARPAVPRRRDRSRSSRAFRTAGAAAWLRPRGSSPSRISDRDGFAVYVSLDGGPAREIHRSQESVVPRRRRGRRPRRRALGGRLAPLPRALRARRPDPPRAPRRRSALGRDGRRAARRRHVAARQVLVARRRATSGSRSSTSSTETSGPGSGISQPASARTSHPTSRAPCTSPTGGRTGRRSSSRTSSRAGPASIATTSRRGALEPCRDRAGLRVERTRPTGRTRLVRARAGPPPAAGPRRHRRGAARPRGGHRPGRPAVRVLALREPARPAGARLLRDAGRLRTARSRC